MWHWNLWRMTLWSSSINLIQTINRSFRLVFFVNHIRLNVFVELIVFNSLLSCRQNDPKIVSNIYSNRFVSFDFNTDSSVGTILRSLLNDIVWFKIVFFSTISIKIHLRTVRRSSFLLKKIYCRWTLLLKISSVFFSRSIRFDKF